MIEAMRDLLYTTGDQLNSVKTSNLRTQFLLEECDEYEWDGVMMEGFGQSLDVMITSIRPLIAAANELERAANSITI